MQQSQTKKNQSVEKVLQIIEIMSEHPEPMRLIDIAAQAELPQSTALRLIRTLMAYGYARQNPETLKYALTLKFSRIGYLVSAQNSIAKLAHPYLISLAASCRESTCLAVEENMEVVYIDVGEGPDSMLQIMQRIGKRAPMHCTGIGKMLLLNYDWPVVADYYKTREMVRYTPNTIGTPDELFHELSRVSVQGYALDNEECELGARCIAVGVRDYSGKYIAGLSVSGPTSRMTMERIEQVRPELIRVSRELSALFSYPGHAR